MRDSELHQYGIRMCGRGLQVYEGHGDQSSENRSLRVE